MRPDDRSTIQQRHRFETLDGMRGLCALLVLVGHIPLALNIPELVPHGWLSVDMFFVLSGFVIALSYERRLRSGMRITSFMEARARRLLPVQILGTLICALCIAPVFWHAIPGWLMTVITISTLCLIPMRWLPVANLPASLATDFAINPPLWSLHGEWIINALYGLFLNRWSSRLLLLPIAFAAAHVIYRGLATDGSGVGQFGVDRTIIGFTLGVLICRAYASDRLQGLPKVRPSLVYAAWTVTTCVPLFGRQPLLDTLPGLALSGILVTLLVRNEQGMGKAWAYLGVLSYPLYASHFAIINLFNWLWPSAVQRSTLLVIPLVIAQISVAAALMRIETAAHRLWRRRHDRIEGLLQRSPASP